MAKAQCSLLLVVALLVLGPWTATAGQAGPLPSRDLPSIRVMELVGTVAGHSVPVDFHSSKSGLTIGLYPSVKSQCELEEANVVEAISELFQAHSVVERALINLRPDSEGAIVQELARRNVAILVTSFADGAAFYSSFFAEQMPGLNSPAIILDCSARSQRYWGPSLAHEVAHALNQERGLPAWADEMIAQLVESEAGGARPHNELERFREQITIGVPGAGLTALPTVFEQRRPFKTPAAYSIDFLLGTYFLERFGGWSTLQAMIAPVDTRAKNAKEQMACADLKSRFEQMACLGRLNLVERGFDAKVIDRLGTQGLLRHFAAAMILSSSTTPKYSIPDWPSLSSTIAREPSFGTVLEPGQFWLAPVNRRDPVGARFHKELEVYRIQYSFSHFRIITRGDRIPDHLADEEGGEWPDEVMLLINSGAKPLSAF